MRLAEAIRADRVSPGQVSIWWLGQAGFAFKTPGALVLIDPYLSDYCREEWGGVRKLQAPLEPAELEPDVVLASHWHPDHLDPPTFRAFAANHHTRVPQRINVLEQTSIQHEQQAHGVVADLVACVS